jgi:Holliday junction resolvase
MKALHKNKLGSTLYLCWGGQMKIKIKFQHQCGSWHRCQIKQNQEDAYRVDQHLTISTVKLHRLVDGDGCLLDLIDC